MAIGILFSFLVLVSDISAQDPAVRNIHYNDNYTVTPAISEEPGNFQILTPPEIDLTLNASSGEDTVYVSFTSNQPLYAGWGDTTLCSTYLNWDYWWLNTRLGFDNLDTLYVLTSLFNYSNTNYNFHRDVLDYTGNVIYQDAEWNGFQMQPIVTDGLGYNHYIGHTLMGWDDNMDCGAVDDNNYIYSSKADGDGNLFFSLLDSVGNYIYNKITVAEGDTAQSWAGDSHVDIDSEGNIYICWSRDMHEIVYSKSTDGGANWSLPVTIASDFSNQVNKPEILVGHDDHIHFIWQHWTGSHNCLTYKKLYPDESCCVDTTNLTPSMTPEVWSPDFVMDADTNIHIVWSPSHSGSNSLYYTLIDGKLDKGGEPASDAEISIVQEYPFYTNSEDKRYPKVVTDSLCCPNVIFDQGVYGSGNTKTVYHIREMLEPRGYAIFPDSSIHKLEIDTVGGYTSSFLTSGAGTYFVKVWGWNSSGEVGWDTASINITGIAENDKEKVLQFDFSLKPNVFSNITTIRYRIPSKESMVSLKVYNIRGQVVREFSIDQKCKSSHFTWMGEDNSGRILPSGLYFICLETKNYREVKQTIVIK